MFFWEQRTKLYVIKIFQMDANKTNSLLDCIAEPGKVLQTSYHELLHKNLRASLVITVLLDSHPITRNLDQISNTFEIFAYSAMLNISCPPLPTLIYA